MHPKNKFLIILVNYKNPDDTIECITSLLKTNVNLNTIYVIENGSNDDSYKKLSNNFPALNIYVSAKNLGFSGANNVGIKYALENDFEYAILLNNDTIVAKDSIQLLIKNMDSFLAAALGSGQIRNYPESNTIWYAGGKIVKWRGLAVHTMYGEKIDNEQFSTEPQKVTFISGCYMAIRLSKLALLGLLEEKFFLYLEDIEYSARAVSKGLTLMYFPASIIYHKWRGEKKLGEQTLYYAVRNRNLLVDLSFPKYVKIYFTAIIYLKMAYWFFTRRALFLAAKRGLSDYHQNIFGPISK